MREKERKLLVLLYSASKANTKGSNTGRIFYACKKSGCFQDIEISRFREVDRDYGFSGKGFVEG